MLDEESVLKAAVAKLLAAEYAQTEIAITLGISQSTVSRLRKNNKHLRENKPTFVPHESLSPDENTALLAEVDKRLKSDVTRKKLTHTGDYDNFHVDVIYGEGRLVVEDRGFHERLAPTLSKLISRSASVGVAWDLGIKPYAEDIPHFFRHSATEGDGYIHFIPLCGITSSEVQSLERSSTKVAMDYHKLVNKGFPLSDVHLLNLNCIPLVHPESEDHLYSGDRGGIPSSQDVIKYLERAFPDYERIFGSMANPRTGQKPLIDEVDMIITGVGNNIHNSMGLLDMLYPDRDTIPNIRQGRRRLTKVQLCEEVIVGDIASILLPNPDYPNSSDITNELNNRLATLRAKHLVKCCERAQKDAEKKKPGVVAICDTVESAPALLQAIRLGYVSRAIINTELSNAIAISH